MERMTIKRFGQRIHLDQQLELIARLQELSIRHLDFTTNTLHQKHHGAKAEQDFKQQIKNGRVVQEILRDGDAPESFARSKRRHVDQKPDAEEEQRRRHYTNTGTRFFRMWSVAQREERNHEQHSHERRMDHENVVEVERSVWQCEGDN